MTFQELNLIDPILKALTREGYQIPTPIQEQAIPSVLQGRDLLGCAQTGTGKTAAFAVPVLQLLAGQGAPKQGKRPIRALVLSPTRELAIQNYECFCAYGRNLNLRTCVIFGGVSQVPQAEKLRRGVDILVATPGRLNDLIGQGLVDLKMISIFVLDEADRMLDMGFLPEVKRILAQVPKQKQTLLFSATMPPEIQEIAAHLLHDPVHVSVTPPATTVESIDQSVYFVDKCNKSKLLIHLLRDPSIVSALVFTRTKHGADRLVRELVKAHISAQAIHGNKSQTARQDALSNFKNGKIRVLAATDIAARGIDIDELSHVFNFDIPEVPETYVHRIGRTGRAGLSGIAVSLCDINEKADWKGILRLIGRDVPVIEDHPYPMQIFTPTPKSELRRGRGARPQSTAAANTPELRAAAPAKDRFQRPEAKKGKPVPACVPEDRPLSALEVIQRQQSKAARRGAKRPQAKRQEPAGAKQGARREARAPQQEKPAAAPHWQRAEPVRKRPADQMLSDRPLKR